MKQFRFLLFALLCTAIMVSCQPNKAHAQTTQVTNTVTATCKATTKGGKACTRKALASGYCKQHDPATVHCAGKNKDGKPCGSLPIKGSTYCRVHQPKA